MLNVLTVLYSIICFSSIMMIISNNAVYSVFYSILIYLNVSILLIVLNVDFLGILLFIVYVGAIAILFLFIIMMVDIKKINKSTDINLSVSIYLLGLFFSYLVLLFYTKWVFYIPDNLNVNVDMYEFVNFDIQGDEDNNLDIVRKIGYVLFNEYYHFLILSGLLLLVSMIGSIYLTNIKRGYTYKSQYNQFYSNYMLLNSHIS